VENFQLISDKILSKTQGYVSKYDVVPGSEKQELPLRPPAVKCALHPCNI
jgi:hypothetical protein